MSDDKVELVRRLIEAYNRGDYIAAAERTYPEVELVPPGDQSPYRGISQLREWMKPDALANQKGGLRDAMPSDTERVSGGVAAPVRLL